MLAGYYLDFCRRILTPRDSLPDLTPDNHYLGGKLITMELAIRKCIEPLPISR